MLVILETVLYSLLALLGLLLLFASPGLRKDDLRSDDDGIKILGATITAKTLAKLGLFGMAGYGVVSLLDRTAQMIITTGMAMAIVFGTMIGLMLMFQMLSTTMDMGGS